MSNIYEALVQAEQEKKGDAVITLPEARKAPAPHCPGPATRMPSDFSTDQELFDLYQHISGALQAPSGTTIQFISARPGEGVSGVVREFARSAALRCNKRVLVMDAAHHNPTQHLLFGVAAAFGWRDAISAGTSMLKGCHKTTDPGLYLSPISATATLTPRLHDDDAAGALFSELRETFDLIVIDSSPAATSADSVALTRLVDGVVLVLEAETTRRPVAEIAKNRIVKAGGNILGVILNKRRFYIPDRIYSRFC